MFVRCGYQPLLNTVWSPIFSVKNLVNFIPPCTQIYLKKTVCVKRCIMTSAECLKGHSKWQNIRHTKEAKDKERSVMMTRFMKLIRDAVKVGGSEPKYNNELARAIARAKENEVPVVKIEQAIKDATKVRDAGTPHLLEASGPGNSFILINVFTDNVNRVKSGVGAVVKKSGGKIREHGYAKKMFECKGHLMVHLTDSDNRTADDFLDVAIEASAEDVKLEDGEDGVKVLTFVSSEEDMFAVKKALQDKFEIKTIEKDYTPKLSVLLSETDMVKAEKLFEKLDSFEEVTGYYDNIEMPS